MTYCLSLLYLFIFKMIKIAVLTRPEYLDLIRTHIIKVTILFLLSSLRRYNVLLVSSLFIYFINNTKQLVYYSIHYIFLYHILTKIHLTYVFFYCYFHFRLTNFKSTCSYWICSYPSNVLSLLLSLFLRAILFISIVFINPGLLLNLC